MNRLQTKKPVKITFKSGGRTLGETYAKRHRKDVELKRVHPTGLCGFDFDFPSDVDITECETLDIYLNSSSRPFKRLSTKRLHVRHHQEMPPILFMHIPKTAGTSFNAMMRLYYPGDKAAFHIEGLPQQRYKEFAVEKNYLSGHLPVGKLKQFFSVKAYDCYSIIRTPFRNLHSHLNWLKGIARDRESVFFQQHNPAIQGLARKIDGIDFSSLQKVEKFVSELTGFERDFFDNCQTRYFLDYRPEVVTSADLPNALANIELFKYIGLTEKYDAFIQYIHNLYSLPHPPSQVICNASIVGKLYDDNLPDLQKIFLPLVETDLRIYKHVKERFSGMA